jgi:hypothetical protein
MIADRRQVTTAGDERHVVTRARKFGPVIAADRTGSEDSETHW